MSTIVKTSNIKCRECVQSLTPFDSSNLYARYHRPRPNAPEERDRVLTHRYVVYSYGEHWPLFVAEWLDDGPVTWYENIDKYSATTSRHKSQAHPHVNTMPMDAGAMRIIATFGTAGLVVYSGKHPDILRQEMSTTSLREYFANRGA